MSTTTAERRSIRPGNAAALAWLRLVRVFLKVDRQTSGALRCSGLSVAHFDVLAHLAAREGINQQELADSLLVTKGNVCQLLSRMEEGGLIRRDQQGRTNRVFLTPEGRELFDAVAPAHEERLSAALSTLSESDLKDLHRILRDLDHALA